ncbi:uncharacterized protein LOC34621021 [Cyclospora cayetanensis]|uniref:Uncharacterized protein LOC34621021 n=1 Tax=Cyclospora cayetanensis TaxID=88456 RepID=A0A6P6S2L0_9EIME|nr:uncharacterized protein LOC34621021 [Cyclospora cayetanensis]
MRPHETGSPNAQRQLVHRPVCDATAPTRSASRSACVGISTDAEDCKTNSRSCKGEGSSSGLALRDADFLRRVSKWLLLQSVLGINTHPTTEQLLQQQHQLGQERRNLRLSSIEDLQRRYASLSPCSAATAVDAAGPQAQPHEAACGRITSIRNGGAFFDISPLNDPNGAVKLQMAMAWNACSLVEGDLGAFRAAGACEGGTSRCSVQHLLPLLDLGDVVLVRGIMRKTLRGELTVDLSHGFQRGSHAPLQPLVLLAKQLLPPEAVGFLQQSPASAAIATARLLLLQHIADVGPASVCAAALQEKDRLQQQQPQESSRNPWLPQLLLVQRYLGRLQQQLQRSREQQQQEQQQQEQEHQQQEQHQQEQQQQEQKEQQQQEPQMPQPAWDGDNEAEDQHQLHESSSGIRNVSLLLQNPERRRLLRGRSAIIKAVRSLLDGEGFLSVDTPCLLRMQQQQQRQQQQPPQQRHRRQQQHLSAAAAPPPSSETVRLFASQLNATKAGVVLRQAPELNLKKLVIAGVSDKLYEIGRCFRNEGISWRHHFEFTSLEVYAVLHTAADMRRLTQMLLAAAAAAASALGFASAGLAAAADKAPSAGTTPGGMLPRELEGRGIFKSVNWATPFQEIAYFDAIKTYTGIELQNLRHEEALRQAEELLRQQQQHQEPLPSRCVLSKEHLSAFLFKRFVEPRLLQPTHVLHPPLLLSPLAAPAAPPPAAAGSASAWPVPLAERFETYVGGMEIADGYAELACPSEQRRRLAAQTAKLQSLDTETAAANAEDFVDCLALGLPPTAGLGVGIDRLVQLLMGVASIRDVMFLPTAA